MCKNVLGVECNYDNRFFRYGRHGPVSVGGCPRSRILSGGVQYARARHSSYCGSRQLCCRVGEQDSQSECPDDGDDDQVSFLLRQSVRFPCFFENLAGAIVCLFP